ncbi:hypothetical protein QL285_061171 [Trifolium repens]|nr:hypothetical protein QL285_061171 [Trifolium repens]
MSIGRYLRLSVSDTYQIRYLVIFGVPGLHFANGNKERMKYYSTSCKSKEFSHYSLFAVVYLLNPLLLKDNKLSCFKNCCAYPMLARTCTQFCKSRSYTKR